MVATNLPTVTLWIGCGKWLVFFSKDPNDTMLSKPTSMCNSSFEPNTKVIAWHSHGRRLRWQKRLLRYDLAHSPTINFAKDPSSRQVTPVTPPFESGCEISHLCIYNIYYYINIHSPNYGGQHLQQPLEGDWCQKSKRNLNICSPHIWFVLVQRGTSMHSGSVSSAVKILWLCWRDNHQTRPDMSETQRPSKSNMKWMRVAQEL